MIIVDSYLDRTVTKSTYSIRIEAGTPRLPAHLDGVLADGILKRIFSKQICFSYDIVNISVINSNTFDIKFKFVCWNSDGQRKRYASFQNMDQSKIEEGLEQHKNKTMENFVGEFFKRLKRGKFNILICGKPAKASEVCL